MKLTAKLAKAQLKTNPKRAIWTLLGIVLSTSMITAVFGFVASSFATIYYLVGGELRDVYYTMMIGVGLVLSSIIVAASVIVISNAFRISAGERLSQFGILKSVGATKRQIAESIMYESLFLSLIGIPIGIAVGLLVQFIGMEIANYLVRDLLIDQSQNPNAMFRFVIAWQAIIVSIVIALGTVLLSAWLPGRKAAKIPAISAILRHGDVKVKAKHVRANWLVKKLFRFEGMLASKSLKRSKRNFRATVWSLSISIVLFIAASSFGAHLNRMAQLVLNPLDADVVGEFATSMEVVLTEDGDLCHFVYDPMSPYNAEAITARLREFPDTEVMSVGTSSSNWRVTGGHVPISLLSPDMYQALVTDETYDQVWMSLTLVTLDAETYAELSRRAGVPIGSNIIVNYSRQHVDGRWVEFLPFNFAQETVTIESHDYILEVPLHGELRIDQIPRDIMHATRGRIAIIVPPFEAKAYFWFAQTDDPRGFTIHTHEAFDELIPPSDLFSHRNVFNFVAIANQDRALARLVMVFVYGFIGMLTLIAVTNVISTIFTNVRSRAREFAVLQSVGMTRGGLSRMLNLESILCSFKSLVVGIPLGVGAALLIYQAMLHSVEFRFEFPLFAILLVVLAVFIITWITMRYSASRLRGKNIVETIRME
ncbi:MAG: ABC transporter permease [Defluviitaleaceae bacterium]|nr:ABC transporter permease [Defluviitaleaceae bacterium]